MMSDSKAPPGRSKLAAALRPTDPGILLACLCVLFAALLRVLAFPHGLSPTETDEPSYLRDGLLVLEGVTPAHKYAPSGPLTWFSAIYGGGAALVAWLSGGSEIAGFPRILQPIAALEAALFHLYADSSSLRIAAVTAIVLSSLASVAAAWRLGRSMAGIPGALVAALLSASVPVCIEQSTQTRPYAIGWAFALWAISIAGAGMGRSQPLRAGLLLGLAVGTHIDMLRVVPLVLLLQWRRAQDRALPWNDFKTVMVTALTVFLVVAPWYVTHLVDNIRQIISVRILPSPAEDQAPAWVVWWNNGILLPLAVAVSGLLLASRRRRWPDLLCGVWLLINAVIAARLPSHGLHHDGGLVVATIALVPLGMFALADLLPSLRRPIGATLLAVLMVGPAAWQGVSFAQVAAHARSPDDATAWLESHVPAGTRVYIEGSRIATPLPTPEAAERLWADVASPDAWVPKYIRDTKRFGLAGARALRVMSVDRLASDLGNRRPYYILGAPLQPNRPRYDLWIVSLGSFYDVSPDAAIDWLCGHGGIYIRQGEPLPRLPPPAAAWVRTRDDSTYVYRVTPGSCSMTNER